MIKSAPVLLSDQTLSRNCCRAGAGQRIERAERLVEQQEARLGGQRPGDADALAHAAGQFPDVLSPGIVEADLGEQVISPQAALALGNALEFQRKGDIVAGVQPGIEGIVLKDDGTIERRAR